MAKTVEVSPRLQFSRFSPLLALAMTTAFLRVPVLSIVTCLAFDCVGATVQADLRLPNVFGNRMVLQQGKPVTIWGWAKPDDKVTVTFGQQSLTTSANKNGEWQTQLQPMEASFDKRDLTIESSDDRAVFTDVLVGEVWLCGGQSNMEWSLPATRDADIEIPSADYPAIRYLRMPHVARPQPQDDFPIDNPDAGGRDWKRAIPEEIERCTGVGYYFAKRLQRRLKVPVGLIDSSWGGTMAQHWVSKDTLKTIPEMKSYFDDFSQKVAAWDEGGGAAGAKQRLATDLANWEAERIVAKQKGEREPRRPNSANYEDPSTKRQPAGMYNAMIMPIAKFTIRGVLFYQGENNSFGVSWKPFPKTFPAVFRDWRSAFGDDEMPVGIIQVAGWSNRRTMTYDMNHHTNIVREVQHLTWDATPNSGLITTYDTNSNGSIHPGRKQPVGERSARWALAEVYAVTDRGKPLKWRGPVYKSMKVNDGKIEITFADRTDRGLRLDQDAAAGFYIAGADREFHIANARVTTDSNRMPHVVVWHDEVKEPVAVRYAWSNLPLGSLMNGRELPAYPFRTDDWPLVPHQSDGEYNITK